MKLIPAVAALLFQIADCEKRCLQLETDLGTYQLGHSHPNNDYEAQGRQRDLYQKVSSSPLYQCVFVFWFLLLSFSCLFWVSFFFWF